MEFSSVCSKLELHCILLSSKVWVNDMLLLKAGFLLNGHKLKFIKEIIEAAYGKWTSSSCRIIDFFFHLWVLHDVYSVFTSRPN
jgi:hypothetical protein